MQISYCTKAILSDLSRGSFRHPCSLAYKSYREQKFLSKSQAQTISEYVKAINDGKASSPAYQRKGDSVDEIWSDTRPLRRSRHLWGFGASEPRCLRTIPNRRNFSTHSLKKNLSASTRSNRQPTLSMIRFKSSFTCICS
jgi:hypothetical protein